jgi:methionine-rich copper-binding protein CopC
MNRVLLIGLVVSAVATTAAAADKKVIERLPENGTLTAEFPSAHSYIIEVSFSEKDKAGTFKAQVFDPSTAGDYDRRKWEDFRTKTNAPGSGEVSRKIEFTTSKGVRETEREQIVARIEREKKLIEKPGLDTVTLPPLPGDKPKGDARKGDASNQKVEYDESAPKDVGQKLIGTRWRISQSGTDRDRKWRSVRIMEFKKGDEVIHYDAFTYLDVKTESFDDLFARAAEGYPATWTSGKNGTINFKMENRGRVTEYKGKLADGVIIITASDGEKLRYTPEK